MELFDTMKTALNKAEQELTHASYLSESGANAGIRKMNDNKAEWLRWVVYLAQRGLEAYEEEERLKAEQELVEEEDTESICDQCPVSTETGRLLAIKDDIIQSLRIEIEDLRDKLNPSKPATVAAEEDLLSRTLCMDEGPNQFKTIYYKPTCPHGCIDCVWDPMYIYSTYPGWYKKLYGEADPKNVVCEDCPHGERYDDEDK